MLRIVLALGLVATASPVLAGNTDWGIRAVTGEKVTPKVVDAPHERIVVPPAKAYVDPYLPQAQTTVTGGGGTTGFNMGGVASIGGRYGRVTSTYRSPQHNRAVGGVAAEQLRVRLRGYGAQHDAHDRGEHREGRSPGPGHARHHAVGRLAATWRRPVTLTRKLWRPSQAETTASQPLTTETP